MSRNRLFNSMSIGATAGDKSPTSGVPRRSSSKTTSLLVVNDRVTRSECRRRGGGLCGHTDCLEWHRRHRQRRHYLRLVSDCDDTHLDATDEELTTAEEEQLWLYRTTRETTREETLRATIQRQESVDRPSPPKQLQQQPSLRINGLTETTSFKKPFSDDEDSGVGSGQEFSSALAKVRGLPGDSFQRHSTHIASHFLTILFTITVWTKKLVNGVSSCVGVQVGKVKSQMPSTNVMNNWRLIGMDFGTTAVNLVDSSDDSAEVKEASVRRRLRRAKSSNLHHIVDRKSLRRKEKVAACVCCLLPFLLIALIAIALYSFGSSERGVGRLFALTGVTNLWTKLDVLSRDTINSFKSYFSAVMSNVNSWSFTFATSLNKDSQQSDSLAVLVKSLQQEVALLKNQLTSHLGTETLDAKSLSRLLVRMDQLEHQVKRHSSHIGLLQERSSRQRLDMSSMIFQVRQDVKMLSQQLASLNKTSQEQKAQNDKLTIEMVEKLRTSLQSIDRSREKEMSALQIEAESLRAALVMLRGKMSVFGGRLDKVDLSGQKLRLHIDQQVRDLANLTKQHQHLFNENEMFKSQSKSVPLNIFSTFVDGMESVQSAIRKRLEAQDRQFRHRLLVIARRFEKLTATDEMLAKAQEALAGSAENYRSEWLNQIDSMREQMEKSAALELKITEIAKTSEETVYFAKKQSADIASALADCRDCSKSSLASGSAQTDGANRSELSEQRVLQIVNKALDLFTSDRTGQPDFALESAGGAVLGVRCTETYTAQPSSVTLFGFDIFRLSRSPRTVIQADSRPGECWAFRGTKGRLVLKLSQRINVTAVTLEHMPLALSPTGRLPSAPANFSVWGLHQESEMQGLVLGRFQFNEFGASVQTFDLPSTDPPAPSFRLLEFQFHDNHGSKEYTCVYRVRVHGKPFLDGSMP